MDRYSADNCWNLSSNRNKKIKVASGANFSRGDQVELKKTVNQKWIEVLKTTQFGWPPQEYTLKTYRTIINVEGDSLEFNMPLYDPYYQDFGGGSVTQVSFNNYISQSGVENIRMEALYQSDTGESHEENAVVMKGAKNCWVQNMVAKYFVRGGVLLLGNSHFITVEDCGMIDHKSIITGGRRYSFGVEHGAFGNLFQRCFVHSGRHPFVSGSQVPGPNVFLDGTSVNVLGATGPHHRYATGQLYDNIWQNKNELAASNNGSYGSGHGWKGAGILFWISQGGTFRVASPPYAMNWAIGNIGTKSEGGVGGGSTTVGSAIWLNHGSNVLPQSLYLQQLQDRAGSAAVTALSTIEQQNGTLRQLLFTKTNNVFQESSAGTLITAQYGDTKPNESFRNLIDNNVDTKYFISGKTALWVKYDFKNPKIVLSYLIASANDVLERDPKNWQLQGSNDNSSWITLDNQNNQIFPSRKLSRTFNITSNEAFRYYRLNITSNNGSTGTQFSEWKLNTSSLISY